MREERRVGTAVHLNTIFFKPVAGVELGCVLLETEFGAGTYVDGLTVMMLLYPWKAEGT
jgi:hypothetical protein